MESFYDNLLTSGFPTCIHNQSLKFDRDAFIAAFWAANPKLEVCPVCDGQRPDKHQTKNKIHADADHFMPKSKYPFLSIHPLNLLPVCPLCNRSFKGDRDPIDDHKNQPLVNIFHPYGSPARNHILILIQRNQQTGTCKIVIEDKSGMPSRRARSFEETYKLHERWPDRLRYAIEEIRDELADAGYRYRDQGLYVDQDEFRKELDFMVRKRQQRIGQRYNYVLHSSYLEFAILDNNEFNELYSQFCGK